MRYGQINPLQISKQQSNAERDRQIHWQIHKHERAWVGQSRNKDLSTCPLRHLWGVSCLLIRWSDVTWRLYWPLIGRSMQRSSVIGYLSFVTAPCSQLFKCYYNTLDSKNFVFENYFTENDLRKIFVKKVKFYNLLWKNSSAKMFVNEPFLKFC